MVRSTLKMPADQLILSKNKKSWLKYLHTDYDRLVSTYTHQ